MADNKIQIKRSAANSTVSGLIPGELAFTANGNVLYIGNPADGASVRIAGLQSPGVLTANQALVANSTSGIDRIIVANLVTSSTLTVEGNTVLGSDNLDVISLKALVNTSIIPSANITYDLGSAALAWKSVYANSVSSVTGAFSGNVSINGTLSSSALLANATAVTITANSTAAVSITANTIKLSGRANNDLLLTDGTGTITGLALGTSGYVLQSNGTAIVYDYLDGGTF